MDVSVQAVLHREEPFHHRSTESTATFALTFGLEGCNVQATSQALDVKMKMSEGVAKCGLFFVSCLGRLGRLSLLTVRMPVYLGAVTLPVTAFRHETLTLYPGSPADHVTCSLNGTK